MKWTRPGHEFDALGARIAAIRKVRIFGAGLNGLMVKKLLEPYLDITGFMDNNPEKRKTGYLGKDVVNPAEAPTPAPDEAVVVALTSFAAKVALAQLRECGLETDVDAFPMQRFCPLYFLYAQDRVCFPSLSFLPTTRCNLRCRHCLNFSPRIARHENRSLRSLQKNLELLFSCVDDIMLFHISGGEPLLYPRLADLTDHIGEKYRHRLGRLEITTNGTIVPSREVCETCRRYDIHVLVDDYRSASPLAADMFGHVVSRLEEEGVAFRVSRPESWLDLLADDGIARGETEALGHFDACAVPWQEYRDGRLWSCNYAGYAALAGLVPENGADCYDLTGSAGEKKRELVEFRLGCNARGYTEFCRRCAGYGNNRHRVGVAGQLD